MALSNQDRILESSTTTGTGTYTLAGAVTGFRSFSIVGNANTVQYSAWEVDASGNPSGGWENGLGTYTASGTTLTRTTIYSSSNSNAAVNWSAGTRYIACSPLTEGTLVVRQPGGTVGTHEGYLSQNGTSFIIGAPGVTGAFQIGIAGLDRIYVGSDWFSDTNFYWLLRRSNSSTLELSRLGAIGWSSTINAYDTTDTCLSRAAAGVVRGSESDGTNVTWIQNTAGEAALESAFTRSDATLTSTNLSLTVIAGRSYRITGYLIVSNSVAGEGAKFDFDGGTATATTFDVAFNAVGGTVVPGTIAATAIATDLNYTSVTGTTRIFVQGYLEVNAGGTFILRASEDSTVTGTMTLGAGSWLALADTVDK